MLFQNGIPISLLPSCGAISMILGALESYGSLVSKRIVRNTFWSFQSNRPTQNMTPCSLAPQVLLQNGIPISFLPSHEAISMILGALKSYGSLVSKRTAGKLFWSLHRNEPTQNVTHYDLALTHPGCYSKR